MSAANDLRAPVVGHPTCRFTDEEHAIINPGEYVRAKQGAVDDVLACLSECDEVIGEVATIDGRHIFRVECAMVGRATMRWLDLPPPPGV
jgi:hypothetical protein